MIELNMLNQTSINENIILYKTVFNWGKVNWCPWDMHNTFFLSRLDMWQTSNWLSHRPILFSRFFPAFSSAFFRHSCSTLILFFRFIFLPPFSFSSFSFSVSILPARRYASAGTSYAPVSVLSVCMSVTSRCSVKSMLGLIWFWYGGFFQPVLCCVF